MKSMLPASLTMMPMAHSYSDRGYGSIQSISTTTTNTTNTSSGLTAASSSSLSSATDYTTHPFIRINDRTYLRDPDNAYPLPCDLAEIHRQTLRSLTLMRVFGAPFCAAQVEKRPPKRVLELACGSGLWSSTCHEYFSLRGGQSDTSFTGLDITPLAPNLRKRGMNWHFVRHDIRKPTLPFPSDHFDFIFIKDAGLCQSALAQQTDLLSEPLRVLKRGGILEVWDSDHVFRALLPNPTPPPRLAEKDQEHADATATYTISSATPFAAVQNKYLQDYNSWVEKAFEQRKLSPMPCATIGLSFTTEADSFKDVGSRRIAIPLGEARWERDGYRLTGAGGVQKALTADQLALRRTALTTVIQMIEGMEPMLMEASGKSRDEWDRWWAAMTTDLLQKNGLASGECLEVGAWWGQKR
jgi:SAM-dependent methyltransferase